MNLPRKILFVADIGGHRELQYYHVGDEAMFLETYRWYKQHHSQWTMSAFSWHKMHTKLDVLEVPHLHWHKKTSRVLLKLSVLYLLWKCTRISFLQTHELEFISTIEKQDRIHFTGGGNLSSLFRPWLYYCFFILLVAKCSKIPVLLTSQTLGPFRGVDRFFAACFLNTAALIATRDQTSRRDAFFRYGLLLPQFKNVLDAAYTLPLKYDQRLQLNSHKKSVTIGLSVHSWKDSNKKTILLIQKAISELEKKHTVHIVLIPHHISSVSREEDDITFMKTLTSNLPVSVSVQVPDIFPEMLDSADTLAQKILCLTSQVDMLITTRYHGIIFALAQKIPLIVLNFDEYYRIKNAGALHMFFGEKASEMLIDVNNRTASFQLTQKLSQIFLQEMSMNSLVEKNNQLDIPHLDTILTDYEQTLSPTKVSAL